MRIKRLLPYLLCVVFWPAGIYVQERMHAIIATAIWWLMHETGTTSLSRNIFNLDAWIPLAFGDGFLLGLIPVHRLLDLVTSSFAGFRARPIPVHVDELSPARPILWAWVLPSTLFLIRVVTWNELSDESVLGASSYAHQESTFHHFFGLPTSYNLSVDTLAWFDDRLFITSPMLFLGAYAAAVWLRHNIRLPQHKDAALTVIESIDAERLGS